jgi:hypothetical protein
MRKIMFVHVSDKVPNVTSKLSCGGARITRALDLEKESEHTPNGIEVSTVSSMASVSTRPAARGDPTYQTRWSGDFITRQAPMYLKLAHPFNGGKQYGDLCLSERNKIALLYWVASGSNEGNAMAYRCSKMHFSAAGVSWRLHDQRTKHARLGGETSEDLRNCQKSPVVHFGIKSKWSLD